MDKNLIIVAGHNKPESIERIKEYGYQVDDIFDKSAEYVVADKISRCIFTMSAIEMEQIYHNNPKECGIYCGNDISSFLNNL